MQVNQIIENHEPMETRQDAVWNCWEVIWGPRPEGRWLVARVFSGGILQCRSSEGEMSSMCLRNGKRVGMAGTRRVRRTWYRGGRDSGWFLQGISSSSQCPQKLEKL